MATVRAVLDLAGRPGRDRVLTFRVTLSAAEEGDIMRAGGCKQDDVRALLEGAIHGLVSTVSTLGARGRKVDDMIAAGDILIGRASPEL